MAPEPSVRRPPSPQVVLEVVEVEWLTPHLVRVTLGGAQFDRFVGSADPARLAATDKYSKLLFAKPELGLQPPYDLDALRETLPIEDMPVRRTYTIRRIDSATQTLSIDFVVHGDEGVAGPWAANARVGDLLAMSLPGGAYAPSGAEVHYVFLGDESAVPAIAAALERLPEGAERTVLIEVGDAADEVALDERDGVTLEWLHRDDPDRSWDYGERLVDAVRGLPVPDGPVEVFAHGEREAMKTLRPLLLGAWGLERRDISLSAYWAKGRTEDTFQAEKRQPIGQIFDPV